VSAELVRALFDDFNRGDFDAALSKLHEDVDWEAPPDMPDVSEAWRGPDEVFGGIARFVAAWDHLDVDLEVLRDAGDRVVIDSRWAGRSRGTGIDVEQRFAQIYDLRGGKIARVRQFRTPEEALAAAALA
jgi:ketosteroid isomerase-like protein